MCTKADCLPSGNKSVWLRVAVVRQCWGTEKPHLTWGPNQRQVYVDSQKAAHALEVGGKFAVTTECSCLQRDLAAQGVSLWVCGHSGNFTDFFPTGHTWRPVPGFPSEHIKDKECLHLACSSQRHPTWGRGQCLCTAPAAALVWDLSTSPSSRIELNISSSNEQPISTQAWVIFYKLLCH